MWTSHPDRNRHPGYTGAVFETDRFQGLVDRLGIYLMALNKETPFDVVAGTGNSGALLCAALSYKLGIPLITVRKEVESHCSGMTVTGHYLDSRYLIIDDLISSGKTMKRVVNEINRASSYTGRTSKCVGIVLYHRAHYINTWRDDENSIPIHFVNADAL